MADFRKLIYALALVALFIGVSTSANAQGMYCNSLTAVPELVRAEGLTEYVGDIVIQCLASTPSVRTPAGQVVPAANVHVRILGTTITSKKVGTVTVGSTTTLNNLTEALLIVDEAGKPGSAILNQTYCGKGGNDSGPSGLGVCSIIAPVDGTKSYDGTGGTNTQQSNGTTDNNTCTATTYGCGRPNVYQARLDNASELVFPSVPMDPPGTNGIRTFRITNVRIDATKIDPASTTGAVAFVTIEGTASVSLQNTTVPVAFTQAGMGKTVVTADSSFLQCVANADNNGHKELIRITEGFRSAWKPKNVEQYYDNSVAGPTNWTTAATRFTYNSSATPPPTTYSADASQNLPDYHYFTESGFMSTAFGSENGINKAGVADYGTRVQFNVSNPPGGNTTLSIPLVVYLYNNLSSTGAIPTVVSRLASW